MRQSIDTVIELFAYGVVPISHSMQLSDGNMDQKDGASLLPSSEERLLSGVREEEAFRRWLKRMEYLDGESRPMPGRMTRMMLILNAIGLVTHTGAFIFEVAYGARFNKPFNATK
tara:strand:- start:927 stop:1271 length:345 start_codon:yes stop_codon:yes gene_type:complete